MFSLSFLTFLFCNVFAANWQSFGDGACANSLGQRMNEFLLEGLPSVMYCQNYCISEPSCFGITYVSSTKACFLQTTFGQSLTSTLTAVERSSSAPVTQAVGGEGKCWVLEPDSQVMCPHECSPNVQLDTAIQTITEHQSLDPLNGNFVMEIVVTPTADAFPYCFAPIYFDAIPGGAGDTGLSLIMSADNAIMRMGDGTGDPLQHTFTYTAIPLTRSTFKLGCSKTASGRTCSFAVNENVVATESLPLSGDIYSGGGGQFGNVWGWQFKGELHSISISPAAYSTVCHITHDPCDTCPQCSGPTTTQSSILTTATVDPGVQLFGPVTTREPTDAPSSTTSLEPSAAGLGDLYGYNYGAGSRQPTKAPTDAAAAPVAAAASDDDNFMSVALLALLLIIAFCLSLLFIALLSMMCFLMNVYTAAGPDKNQPPTTIYVPSHSPLPPPAHPSMLSDSESPASLQANTTTHSGLSIGSEGHVKSTRHRTRSRTSSRSRGRFQGGENTPSKNSKTMYESIVE